MIPAKIIAGISKGSFFHEEFGEKCGEIFIKRGLFSFYCYLCQNTSTELIEFQNHLNENHSFDLELKKNFSLIPHQNNTIVSKPSRKVETLSLIQKPNKAIDEEYNSVNSENSTHSTNSNISKVNHSKDRIVNTEEIKIKLNITDSHPPKENQKDHSKQLPRLPCPHCDRIYQRPKLLKAHIETHLPGYLTCKMCGKTFTTKQNLQTHMQIHNGQFLKCTMCSAKFSKKGNLIQHLKRHSGIKPYLCSYENCKYRALYPGLLRNHEKSHKKVIQEICEICGQTFKDKGYLKEHQKRHNNQRDFKCDKCDKKFYDKKSLTEHQHTHTGVKNFICQICSVLFSTKRNLRAHMKKHSGVKSYICKYCNEGFYLYSERQYHIKSRHKIPK